MAVGDDDGPAVSLDRDHHDSARPTRPARRWRAPGVPPILVVALGCGGMLGAVSRYAISLGLPTQAGAFPWSTLIANVTGSFTLGFLLIVLLERFPRGRLARSVIGTGFIGAYTTFSTFTVEAIELVRDGDPGQAATYLLVSLAAGLLAVWLGMTGARVLLRAQRWPEEELS